MLEHLGHNALTFNDDSNNLNPKFLAAALPALITLLFSNSSVLPQRIQIK